MSRKPVIGITVDIKPNAADTRSEATFTVKSNYPQAVAEAGGIPLLIPPDAQAEDVLPLIDGLLIPGGNDIDPAHYGQPLHPQAELQDPRRFAMEAALYRAAPTDLPILGICYGCQLINVLHGGTLIQHLPDVPAATVHTGGPEETYRLEPGSKMSEALGAETVVGKSYHHQAIDRPGEGISVVGHAADGTIEAIEVEDRDWTIATQWHPERSLGDAAMRSLFANLVKRAANYHRVHAGQPVEV